MPNRSSEQARPSRVRITDVRPQVDCAQVPVKRVVGDTVPVSAIVVADGHVQVRAELCFRPLGTRRWARVPMEPTRDDPDRYSAAFVVDRLGGWEYSVTGWLDDAATWRDELRRKVDAGQTDLDAELAEGAALLGAPVPDVETALAGTE